MKLKFCGAAQTVAGSRHLVEINGHRILLDCGMVQGGDKETARRNNENFLFDPKTVDYVVISHGHIDHVGMVPRLVKQGFKGKIFTTGATRELAEAMLIDSAHIQMQDAAYAAESLKRKIEPLYTELEVRAAMKLFVAYEYGQKFKVADSIWITFQDAGHVLGSAITIIDFKEGTENKRLVFTGDLGRKYLPILNDPYQVPHADYLIIESTYAGHLHDSFQNVREELGWIVNDVAKRGGKIIVPGFSFERTQELVYVLHELYEQKKIPALPIFVDSPLSSTISAIFDKHTDYYDDETFKTFVSKQKSPFYFDQIKYITSVEESKGLNEFDKPCLIIAASGMCEAGRIKHHLKHNIGDPKNLILVVGFMATGTRGREIVEGARTIRLFDRDYPVRAEVVVMNAFSAHADKLELLDYIRHVEDLKNIFIVHGEENECAVLRDNIYNILKLKCRVDIADLGEEFEVTEAGTESHLGTRRVDYFNELKKLDTRN